MENAYTRYKMFHFFQWIIFFSEFAVLAKTIKNIQINIKTVASVHWLRISRELDVDRSCIQRFMIRLLELLRTMDIIRNLSFLFSMNVSIRVDFNLGLYLSFFITFKKSIYRGFSLKVIFKTFVCYFSRVILRYRNIFCDAINTCQQPL